MQKKIIKDNFIKKTGIAPIIYNDLFELRKQRLNVLKRLLISFFNINFLFNNNNCRVEKNTQISRINYLLLNEFLNNFFFFVQPHRQPSSYHNSLFKKKNSFSVYSCLKDFFASGDKVTSVDFKEFLKIYKLFDVGELATGKDVEINFEKQYSKKLNLFHNVSGARFFYGFSISVFRDLLNYSRNIFSYSFTNKYDGGENKYGNNFIEKLFSFRGNQSILQELFRFISNKNYRSNNLSL